MVMRALSKNNDEAETASRPFDATRDGFVMGEGAGVLCLESLDHAKKRGAEIYAEYIGGAFTSDAHHMTEPHPQGAGVSRCIKNALENAGIEPSEVDYINCHGTSTPAGDMAEVKAIKKAIGDTDKLVVNSTKSMVGHCLGAAAGVEAVVCVQALRHKKVHPTLNLEDREDGFDLNAPTEALELPDMKIAANNSFGFGGHNSCVIFKRWEE
jgi:3-oxoacyl-[acyl-carrier-protein] synthase II